MGEDPLVPKINRRLTFLVVYLGVYAAIWFEREHPLLLVPLDGCAGGSWKMGVVQSSSGCGGDDGDRSSERDPVHLVVEA